MKEKLQSIKEQALSKIAEAQDINLLNDIKVSILGKKGELTQVLKSMKLLIKTSKFIYFPHMFFYYTPYASYSPRISSFGGSIGHFPVKQP